jgi:formate/nitrite transporter FocA (FNT family)
VVLVVGIGLGFATGAWAVAVGLALIGTLCFGLLVPYLDRSLKSNPDRVSLDTGTGTAITMSGLSVLPTLVVGILCVVVTHKYWWMGFPAGFFLGFAVSLIALYGAIVVGLRRVHGQLHNQQ